MLDYNVSWMKFLNAIWMKFYEWNILKNHGWFLVHLESSWNMIHSTKFIHWKFTNVISLIFIQQIWLNFTECKKTMNEVYFVDEIIMQMIFLKWTSFYPKCNEISSTKVWIQIHGWYSMDVPSWNLDELY